MKIECIWLGTILKKEEYSIAEEILNEILNTTSCKVTATAIKEGVHVVYFNIEGANDINNATINRLKTADIKWLSDYPEYELKKKEELIK